MKKLIAFFTISTLSLFIIGCTNSNTTSNYDIKELDQEKIEFLINKLPVLKYHVLERGISIKEIQISWEEHNDNYTTKGNKIYHYGRQIKGADIATFIPLLGEYALDKNKVYLGHEALSISPDQFNFVSGAIDYLTDGTSIYWGNQKLEGIDVESFAGMGFENLINLMGYAKDKNNYYFMGKILTGENLQEYLDKINNNNSDM